MKYFVGILFGMIALSTTATASPALPDSTIKQIAATLPTCTGGWYETDTRPYPLIGPNDLLASVGFLNAPSQQLDDRTGRNLYEIARGLMPEIDPLPAFIPDGSSSLKCPERPAEAIALMQYLVGEEPDDWRGTTNTLIWLGVAAEQGIGMPKDTNLARRYYLQSRMHSAFVPNARWADGIDDNLLANIERAGLRPYLEKLASNESLNRNGGAARMILADEALVSNPTKARTWLRTFYIPALNRLLELEANGRIPTEHDHDDIAFWSTAWRNLFGYKNWAARMVKGAGLANGGPIPTSSARPTIRQLGKSINRSHIDDLTYATRDPIPVRALADPNGKVIYVEVCQTNPIPPGARVRNLNVRLDATRLYDLDKLPRLPVTRLNGVPSYGWTILPAAHFQRKGKTGLTVEFADLPAEACAYSGILDVDSAIP